MSRPLEINSPHKGKTIEVDGSWFDIILAGARSVNRSSIDPTAFLHSLIKECEHAIQQIEAQGE